MIKFIKTISKKEWLFVLILSIVLIVITSAPVVYGFLIKGDRFFTGMHFVSADDWFVYYSFINQGKEGSLLFKDLFAPMDHVAVFRPDWLFVGFLAKIFNLSEIFSFHLARILLIPIFFAVSYLFLAYFFSDPKQRKIALSFLAFSSGTGKFLIYRLALNPLNYARGEFQWPMDLWVPDINTFLTLFTSPHFISATILILVIFLLTLAFTENNNYWYPVISGFCGLLLFLIHPFQVLKVFLIVGFFFFLLIIRQRKIIWPLVWNYLIFFILSVPAVLYYLWLMRYDELTNLRTLQNINPTTPLYLTIISFGGLLVFAILGIYILNKQKKIWENKYLFLAVWAILQFFLLYAPVDYQRRLALGIHFPLAVLSLIFFFYFYQNHFEFVKKRLTLIIVSGLLLFLPSTLFALSADIMVYEQSRELSYLDEQTHQALLWIKENTNKESIIFSDVKTGLILPAYSLRTSYVGHAVESPYYRQRKIEPGWFFKNNRNQNLEINFLKSRDINYVFYGLLEKELGSYDPEAKNYLKLVFDLPKVKIYQVLSN